MTRSVVLTGFTYSQWGLVIDKAPRGLPPLYNFRPPAGGSPLRQFIALPDETLLVLGPRRSPPIAAPESNSNTDSTISICTSVGFRTLNAHDYAEAIENLKVDVLVSIGDIPYERRLGNKRLEKATDRNIQWLEDHISLRQAADAKATQEQAKLFASLLPVSCAKQKYFINELTGRFADSVSGLALYSLDTLEDLPKELEHLPRLGFTTPKNPQEILYQVQRGLDILVAPFVGAATDSGIALNFAFGAAQATLDGEAEGLEEPGPLGVDMWSPAHAVDLSPLTRGCECYACANHHRAYLQHLLAAKEMLGWVLLQIHNHHILDVFFAAIRQSIADDTFDNDVRSFERKYERQLPAMTGCGPRYRYLQHAAKLMAD